MKEMTSFELLASIAHSDMPEATAIIKIGERWISMNIAEITVEANAQFVTTIDVKGHAK